MAIESDGYQTVVLKGGVYEKILENIRESLLDIRCQPCIDGLEGTIANLESAIKTLEEASKE